MDLRREELAQWAVAELRQLSDVDVTAKWKWFQAMPAFVAIFVCTAWTKLDSGRCPCRQKDNPRFVRIARSLARPRCGCTESDCARFCPWLHAAGRFWRHLVVGAFAPTGCRRQTNKPPISARHCRAFSIQALPQDLPPTTSELLQREMHLFSDWLCENY